MRTGPARPQLDGQLELPLPGIAPRTAAGDELRAWAREVFGRPGSTLGDWALEAIAELELTGPDTAILPPYPSTRAATRLERIDTIRRLYRKALAA